MPPRLFGGTLGEVGTLTSGFEGVVAVAGMTPVTPVSAMPPVSGVASAVWIDCIAPARSRLLNACRADVTAISFGLELGMLACDAGVDRLNNRVSARSSASRAAAV